MKKEYPIYERFNKKKLVGKVILTKKFNWDKVTITESLIGTWTKKGILVNFITEELNCFGIIPRDERINRPKVKK